MRALEETPDYAMASFENIFVTIWRQRTSLLALEQLAKHLLALAALQPAGLGIVIIVPANSPPPPNEVRARLAAAISAAPQVKASAVCFEGSGLRATIVRSVVAGLTILSRPSYPHRVFGTLEEGVGFINTQLNLVSAPTRQTSRIVGEIRAWRLALR